MAQKHWPIKSQKKFNPFYYRTLTQSRCKYSNNNDENNEMDICTCLQLAY